MFSRGILNTFSWFARFFLLAPVLLWPPCHVQPPEASKCTEFLRYLGLPPGRVVNVLFSLPGTIFPLHFLDVSSLTGKKFSGEPHKIPFLRVPKLLHNSRLGNISLNFFPIRSSSSFLRKLSLPAFKHCSDVYIS